ERRVPLGERVRVGDLRKRFEVGSLAVVQRRREEVATSVEGEDRGLLERAREEGTGGMRLVVADVVDAAAVTEVPPKRGLAGPEAQVDVGLGGQALGGGASQGVDGAAG